MRTVAPLTESALPASVPARRATARRWRDPRLLGGVALIVAAMCAGALLLRSGGGGTTLIRAVHDLPAGVTLAEADVEQVMVDLPDPQGYLQQVVGGTVVRSVHAGELIPADAVATQPVADVRLVTVAVEPLHAPPGLAPGTHVDVWVTRDTEGATPQLVLADVLVAGVSLESDSASGQWGVVLQVLPADTAAVVAAGHSVVDLVAHPVREELS